MDADYSAPCAIAIGSEKDGLSSIIMNASDEKIRIPMKGTADSLNASVSAGIVLYEAASRLVSRELQ
jgi:TrmH family RNA methyltransferase